MAQPTQSDVFLAQLAAQIACAVIARLPPEGALEAPLEAIARSARAAADELLQASPIDAPPANFVMRGKAS